jgi:hypothetical protein
MAFKKDLDLQRRWSALCKKVGEELGKRPKDLNSMLFLIGVQELGSGRRTFTKEEKQDLMHIAICKVLSYAGFYELEGLDKEGWPHWKQIKPLPHFDLMEQEKLLKMQVIEYFEKELQWNIDSTPAENGGRVFAKPNTGVN